MELLWDGGTKVCSNGPGHLTKMAAMPIYGKNLKKSSSLEPKGRWPWNLVCSIGCMSTTKFIQMMTLGWPWPIIQQGQIWSLMLLCGEKGMHHRVLEYYQVCSKDDHELTLTYFTARSNLVPYAFVWEKGNTMHFSETIVVYYLKLATDDRSDKKFLLTSKFVPWGLYVPCPGAIYMY